MHKIFAKPLFLGKKVIFLTECHSTNEELSLMIKKNGLEEGVVVYTDHQKNGKGQRGNTWIDEPRKNVLISVLVKPNYLLVAEQYLLNVAVGLAVLKCGRRYAGMKNIQMKWPNDILMENRKICGILIENSIKGSKLESAVVGIGFNLNQSSFGLMNATSLFHETGNLIDRDAFMENLLVDLEFFLLKLMNGRKAELLDQYHKNLYLKDTFAEYEDEQGTFRGKIVGIDNVGKLMVEKEDSLQYYGIKEIKFLN